MGWFDGIDLGNIFSGVDASSVATTVAPTVDVGNLISGEELIASNLNTMQNAGVNNYEFSNNNDLGTGMQPINSSPVNLNQVGPNSYQASQVGGLGGSSENITKSNGLFGTGITAKDALTMGLAYNKDRKNEQYRKDVFNFNAREKNDKNQRDRDLTDSWSNGRIKLDRKDQPYI